MGDKKVYEKIPFENSLFPIRINVDSTVPPVDTETSALTWHEQLELLYFKTDGAVVHCSSGCRNAHAGEVFLINPYEIHLVTYGFGNPVYDCVMIDPALYRDVRDGVCEIKYFDNLTDQQICFENDLGADGTATGFIKRMTDEYLKKDFAFELAVKQELFGLFVYLFRNKIKNVYRLKQLINNVKHCEQLDPVFELMRERLSEPVSLAEMAASCCLNPSHFCRVFKKTTGRTPVTYLTEMRLNRAETLLKRTDKSVSQIACEVGIPDICYFSRKFKEHFGYTPSQIKKSRSEDN